MLKSQDAYPLDDAALAAALLSGMPDALIVSDAEGFIRFWNAGATRIFGFTQADAIGQSLDIIIPDNLRARHQHGYAQTMKTGETKYGAGDLLAVPAITKDAQRISVQFSIMPRRDANGNITHIAAILRDVTADFKERKKLRAELAAQHQSENRAD